MWEMATQINSTHMRDYSKREQHKADRHLSKTTWFSWAKLFFIS